MALKNRVCKLEQENKQTGFVMVALNDNETNEEAYQRCFANGSIKPKKVIYATPLDLML